MPPDRGATSQKACAEISFYPPPPSREISVAIRQGQDRVQVFGKNNNGVDRERPLSPSHIERDAQCIDVIDERI
jgi:hypothetical protein